MAIKKIGTDYWLPDGSKHTVSVKGTYVPDDAVFTAPTVSLARLPKLLIIDRLVTASLFDVALSALKASPVLYERWSASQTVDPADVDVNTLLDAIGADKSVVLGPVV